MLNEMALELIALRANGPWLPNPLMADSSADGLSVVPYRMSEFSFGKIASIDFGIIESSSIASYQWFIREY